MRPLPAYDGDEPYIFVTYSHEDTDLVYPQIRWLQDQGFNVGWDEGISPGAVWRGELAQAIRGCSLLLYFTTPNSVESEHCIREVNFALDEHHRPVLAVHLVETALPDALALSLSDRQAILQHALEPVDYERKLVSAVATYLDQPLPEISRPAPSRQSVLRVSLSLAVAGALVVGGFAAITAWFTMRPEPSTPRPLARFPIDLPENVAIPATVLLPHPLDISSDGTRIVFHGRRDDGVTRLYVRPLNEPMATPIQGAEGSLGSLYLSPDGQWVAFHDRSDGALKKVRVSGGSPVTIAKTGAASSPIGGLSWGADGTIVFATDAYPGLMRVSDAGGTPERLTEPPEGEFHAFPHLLSDGRAVLFSALRVDSFEFAQVVVRSLVTGEQQILTEGSFPHVTSSGHLLFAREGSIWAMAFDADRLQVSGKAVPVLENVYAFAGFFAAFSVAADGSMVYLPSSSADAHHLVWMDLDGRESALAAPARNYTFARISPDGRHVAVGVLDEDGAALWTYSVDRGALTRLTSADAVVGYAVWRPDGQELVYSSVADGAFNLSRRSADGTGAARRLTTSKRNQYATSWSADGQEVLYFECDTGDVACDLGRLTMVGEPTQELFLATEFEEAFPALSPSGRWVAYQSNASGKSGIYVRPYPDMDGRKQISIDHGAIPRWSRNGRTLYYIESRGSGSGRVRQMMSVAIEETEDGIEAGVPQPVFDVGPYNVSISYALHPDGERFLLAKLRDRGVHRPILVQNWLEEVKRLVPTD